MSPPFGIAVSLHIAVKESLLSLEGKPQCQDLCAELNNVQVGQLAGCLWCPDAALSKFCCQLLDREWQPHLDPPGGLWLLFWVKAGCL